MPLYLSRLNVPAPPDVVAGRLRAIVRERPGFMESLRSVWPGTSPLGPLFVGAVQGNSFQLCRNITYRNSFLPRIRGRIDLAQNGSRVRVVMYMHPPALLLLLFWLASAAYGAWRDFDERQVSAYIPLVIFISGIAFGLGGFFSEAVKAKRLLFAAMLDSAITTASQAVAPQSIVPQTMVPQTDAHFLQPETSNGRFLRLALAVCLLLLFNSVFKQYTNHFRACPAFVDSMAILSKSKAATAVLGEPIQTGLFLRGTIHQTAAAGYALLSIPVHGSKAKGTLYVVANRFQNRWDLQRVALWTGAKRLDLSPPTRREDFRYPASGKVYLVPLDTAAAEYLNDLPAYLAARLGLDVTVMPVVTPGTELVDPAARQLIAEKVIQFIADSNQQTADVDSVFIGVTSQDINIKSSGWNYASCYRRGRFAVVSTARFQGSPWYAGDNPEVFAVRVRKIVTRNVALLRYPVNLSADRTSVLASSVYTPVAADEMGENFIGEQGAWVPQGTSSPCVSIIQGPGGRQSWMLDCLGEPPADSRFEIFENYTAVPLFLMSRTDLTFSAQPSLPFFHAYSSADNRMRTLGIGTSDSFNIYPAGDSQTFANIDLILPSGERIHFDRVSRGTGYADARLRADTYMGSPFSKATLQWNGNGWDLLARDGWTYKFPASGPGRGVQESSLLRIEAGPGHVFAIERTPEADLRRAQAPDGSWIEFAYDSMHRITRAKKSSGRAVEYEYDPAGRLAQIRDLDNGTEFYQYDPVNRLTRVLDAKGRSLLQNTYGYSGEITSQTLADGRKLLYEYGWDENRTPSYLKLTDPNGYVIEWWQTRKGILWTLPKRPS